MATGRCVMLDRRRRSATTTSGGATAATTIYGGGLGLRFALSQALVARVDVAFSDERLPIVYLAFGHTF